MKEIKKITIDQSPMSSAATVKEFIVEGEPGAMFTATVINEDDHYYNFSEEVNASGALTTALGFGATALSLPIKTISKEGFLRYSIVFPAITDDDVYSIVFKCVGNTFFNNNLSSNNVYVLPKIYKYKDTTVTFSLSSAASSDSYNSLPSNVLATGVSSSTLPSSNFISRTINWPVTLSESQFMIAKQPNISDFQFSTTKVTNSSSDSTGETIAIELTDITGISSLMSVSGTNIAARSIVKRVERGFKDYSKSSNLKEVYVVPRVAETDEQGVTRIVDSKAGTIIISNSSTWAAAQTLTFLGKGSIGSEEFNGTKFEVTNLALTIDPVVTTTDAVVSNSTTIPITSTDGIKATSTVLMTGIGVTNATPHVDAISNGVNITASSAQTIENGQTLTFTGSSRSATITADIKVLQFGKDDITLTLALDNILTVG
tara:strand:- start:1108 stop:2400 length:1293 start_codon:yes stop_codon:yes gene_type:complete